MGHSPGRGVHGAFVRHAEHSRLVLQLATQLQPWVVLLHSGGADFALPLTLHIFGLILGCVLPSPGSSRCQWRSSGASLTAACSGATGPSMQPSAAGQLTSQTRSWSSTGVRHWPAKNHIGSHAQAVEHDPQSDQHAANTLLHTPPGAGQSHAVSFRHTFCV